MRLRINPVRVLEAEGDSSNPGRTGTDGDEERVTIQVKLLLKLGMDSWLQ